MYGYQWRGQIHSKNYIKNSSVANSVDIQFMAGPGRYYARLRACACIDELVRACFERRSSISLRMQSVHGLYVSTV